MVRNSEGDRFGREDPGREPATNASLRRHYPLQVRRVFLTRPPRGQDPYVVAVKLLQSGRERNALASRPDTPVASGRFA